MRLRRWFASSARIGPVVKVGFDDFKLLILFNIFGQDGTSTTGLLEHGVHHPGVDSRCAGVANGDFIEDLDWRSLS